MTRPFGIYPILILISYINAIWCSQWEKQVISFTTTIWFVSTAKVLPYISAISAFVYWMPSYTSSIIWATRFGVSNKPSRLGSSPSASNNWYISDSIFFVSIFTPLYQDSIRSHIILCIKKDTDTTHPNNTIHPLYLDPRQIYGFAVEIVHFANYMLSYNR